MTEQIQRTARSFRPRRVLLLLGVLALLAVGAMTAVTAFGKTNPAPAPTIASGPANPTSQTSATFVFSDSQPGVTFQCSLNGSAYAACSSPKTYSKPPLVLGTNTFSVVAVASNLTSSAASFSWLIDTVAPLTTITISPAAPSGNGWYGGPGPRFTLSATDDASGVATTYYRINGGAQQTYTGSVAVPDGASQTVTYWSVDKAGNIEGAHTTSPLKVDTVAPAVPTFTVTPPDQSSTATSTFSWTDTDPAPRSGIASYLCSSENGPFQPTVGGQSCAPGVSYAVGTSNSGQHQFAVKAVDVAGNVGDAATFTWKVVKGSGQQYTISGVASVRVFPGGVAPLDLSFVSPNAGNGGAGVNGTQVSSLVVTIVSVSSGSNTPNACTINDFTVTQFSGTYPFYLPQGTSTLSSLGFSSSKWPAVAMRDTAANQDGCKGATLNLSYGGTP